MQKKNERYGTLRVEVGCIWYGQFRNFLREMQFKGHDIEFIEGDGWLSRPFVVKGYESDLRYIGEVLDANS